MQDQSGVSLYQSLRRPPIWSVRSAIPSHTPVGRVTIAPAYKHQRPELSAIDELARVHYRRMEAVIVADFLRPAVSAALRVTVFGRVPSTWLLDENALLSDFRVGYRDR